MLILVLLLALQPTLLPGGYSQATNYKMNQSVLRTYPAGQDHKREFYMYTEASKRGVAPFVLTTTPDTILTAYIKPEASELPLKRIARALRAVHSIPYYPSPTILDKYTALSPHGEAIEIIRAACEELKDSPCCNIHGELHSRNILQSRSRVFFIDWTDSLWADPFYDLSYYSLLHNLTPSQEKELLIYYLKHPPTPSEKKRYLLTKKVNLAGLSLTLQKLATTPSSSTKTWSEYLELFANHQEGPYLQGWSELALTLARDLSCE